jgi:hypothetical protein
MSFNKKKFSHIFIFQKTPKMKKREESLAKMNLTIQKSIEARKNINPWIRIEKEWDRKKAFCMPRSLLEKCEEQDKIRAKHEIEIGANDHRLNKAIQLYGNKRKTMEHKQSEHAKQLTELYKIKKQKKN